MVGRGERWSRRGASLEHVCDFSLESKHSVIFCLCVRFLFFFFLVLPWTINTYCYYYWLPENAFSRGRIFFSGRVSQNLYLALLC